jgi:5-methylcytosine-specific restriction endonuclease McrA
MGVVGKKEYEPRTYWHLVQRIALGVPSPEEAQRAVERLTSITVEEWQTYIDRSRKAFRRREKRRVTWANRRAWRKQLPATLTLEQWFEILEYYSYRCAYCRLPFSYDHLEHVVPLSSRIAGTTADNCAPACASCNKRKGRKALEYWTSLFDQPSLFTNILLDEFAQRVVEVREELRAIFPNQHGSNLLETRGNP